MTETPLSIKDKMQIKISDKDVTEGLKEEDFAPTKYYLFLKKGAKSS